MARDKFPSDDTDRLMVRFPPGLRDRIKEAASSSGRSMNAEIISRLQDSFETKAEPIGEDLVVQVASDVAQKAAQAAVVNILTMFQQFNKITGMSYEALVEGYMEAINNPISQEDAEKASGRAKRK